VENKEIATSIWKDMQTGRIILCASLPKGCYTVFKENKEFQK
jgi:hypothetical protein